MSLGFNYVKISISSLFIVITLFIVKIHHNLFMHSLTKGYLAVSYVSAITML